MDKLTVTRADEDAANGWADTIGRLGGVYLDTGQRAGLACAFAAHRLTQSDALREENERLRGIVYHYVDPFDIRPEDKDFLEATIAAALQEQSK